MAAWKKILIFGSSIILVLIGGGLFFLIQFLKALGPPNIQITKEYVSTDRQFVNGVWIEEIRVDSIGDKGYPVKFTTLYTTSCKIKYPNNGPSNSPSKIEFNKRGDYSWDEDTIQVSHDQKGLSIESKSTSDKLWWLNKFGDHPVCPLKFEPGQWYFFTFRDPQVAGIFFYLDQEEKEHQYYLTTGVSPI